MHSTNEDLKWHKQPKVVITFDSPTDAFAFEAACQRHQIPGRLLPVPVTLTGGCGIGWTSAQKDKDLLCQFSQEHNLAIKLITEIVF